MIPKCSATFSLKESLACAFSTDSRRLRVSRVKAGIEIGVGVDEKGSSSGSWWAPWPRTATKMHPRGPDGSDADTGRLGQPMTPSSTRALMMSARQTAYCSPRKNPLVPSIGSSVHIPRKDPGSMNTD